MRGRSELTFSQRRLTNRQQVHEKVLYIINSSGKCKTKMIYYCILIRVAIIKNTRGN